MSNAVFGKKHRKREKTQRYHIVTTDARRIYSVSKPNYHARNFFKKVY